MFLGIGDVQVNLRQKSTMTKHFINIDEPIKTHDWYDMEWVLQVSSLDVDVTISAKTAMNAPREIVASCLLAGLKNVADHWIYDGACAKLESQLGFAVDRWISPEITKIDKEEHDTDGAYFEVSVIPKLFQYLVGQPVITAFNHEDKYEIELTMDVDCGTEKIRSSLFFSTELWNMNGSECVELAKFKFLESLYHQRPEMSHLWTQIRYNWYDMKKMSHESILWFQKIQGDVTGWMPLGLTDPENLSYKAIKPQFKPGGLLNPAADIYYMPPAKQSLEDRRVKELPALNELVKHPVTGQTVPLKSAIISLNDSSKWTREQIADWLETLDIDISFKVKTNEQD